MITYFIYVFIDLGFRLGFGYCVANYQQQRGAKRTVVPMVRYTSQGMTALSCFHSC